MSLTQWVSNGWVVRHRADDAELKALLEVVERDLKQCRVKGVGPDWALSIAYNAALQSARAALFASGYRIVGGESHHFRAIQSFTFTIKADSQMTTKLDYFRKKRNFSDYEAVGAVSDSDVKDMIELADKLYHKTREHIRHVRPSVL